MNDALDKDPVLEGRLRSGSVSAAGRSQSFAAAACQPVAKRPVAATEEQQAQADLQLQFAREAEVAGDPRGMRDALRRAAELDPTNDGIVYRLARASEELREVRAAVQEYCRYLALAPEAVDSAVARERLQLLSSYAVARPSATSNRTTASGRAQGGRIASRRVSPATRTRGPVTVASHAAVTEPAAADSAAAQDARGAAAANDSPAGRPSIISAPQAVASEETERVMAPPQTPEQPAAQPTPEQPATAQPAPRPRRAPERINTRSVMTGAAVGAVMGTIIGRDVRSAVIGAAAGGVLGGISGRTYGGGPTYVPRRYANRS